MNDRRHSQPKDVLSFGPFSLFAAERLLKKADEPIALGGRALDILIALAERAGEVVTHKELISTVWPDVTVEEANLRFQMAALRKALGDGRDGARYVSNVAGRGYCFVASITRSAAAPTASITGITATERVRKLPPRLTRMVGRDDTVRSLAEQLQMRRFARHACALRRSIASPTIAISSRPAATLDDSNAAMTADNRRSSGPCNPSRLRRDERNAREPIVGVRHPGRISPWRQSQLLRTTLIADANSFLSAISLTNSCPSANSSIELGDFIAPLVDTDLSCLPSGPMNPGLNKIVGRK
jgi:DNA-binding winged helix-turn-helix (wHTH) protein